MGMGRRDRTPVVKVTAQGSKRVSVAALITAKPGANFPPDNAHRRLFTMPGISLPSIRTWAVLQEEAGLGVYLNHAALRRRLLCGHRRADGSRESQILLRGCGEDTGTSARTRHLPNP